MKKVFKIILGVILFFAVISAGMSIYFSNGLEEGRNVEILGCDASRLSDGVYNGSYEEGRWTNEVAVSVQNGKIVKIEIIKDVMVAIPGVFTGIAQEVINAQDTRVEIVSGATVTSKAYMKSIENALNK